MKQLFTLAVYETARERVDSLLNKFRIGLNERDVSRVFESKRKIDSQLYYYM